MRKCLLFLCLSAGILLPAALPSRGESSSAKHVERPAALVTGAQMDVKVVSSEVVGKSRIVHDNYIRKWLPPSEYPRYSFIYFGDFLRRGLPAGCDWSKPEDFAAARRYVEGGGIFVLSGSCARDLIATQPAAKELVGFRKTGDLTRKDFGRGRVYLVEPLLGRLKISFKGEPLGQPDEAGRFILNENGRKFEAMCRFYADLFKSLPGVERMKGEIEWDNKPLGSKGMLPQHRTFAREPVFRDPPRREKGVVLYRPKSFCRSAVLAKVVYSKDAAETKSLAEEISWHLGRMSGVEPPVVDAMPDGPAIVLVHESGSGEASSIRTDGDRILLSGRGAGLSHAVTYFLESLGIRYLWPGPLGKVIPRRQEIVAPRLSLDYEPELKLRELRGIEDFGIDRPGNRSFRAWHGVNDMRENRMLGGHCFMDYWAKYGKKHPDWFAMQPDGSRRQDDDAGRFASLCLSSDGFVSQVIKDKLAQFARRTDKDVLGVGLPDGGPTMQCLCRRCRELDPVNAPPRTISGVPYVSLTDRVLTFDNRVAKAVTARFPGKGLHMHAYAEYEDPPVKVRPHPALTVACVVGDYSRAENLEKARGDLAVWLGFGNKILWRPNLLMGFRTMVPQNYSRRLFGDLETMKANGLHGTDFDCFYEIWSSLAITYYTLAKAHLNQDRLSYDVLVDDYCRAGFGKAAPLVRQYFDALEKMTETAAHADRREAANLRMVAALDCDRLSKILAEAERLVEGDERERVRFLGRGVEIGRWMKRLAESRGGRRTAAEYNGLVDETLGLLEAEDDLVANPQVFMKRRVNLFLLEPLLLKK